MVETRAFPERPARRPRIAAIGLASWDRLIVVDRYPRPGGYAIVTDEFVGPGGTTSNAAVALARLGADVFLRAAVGDDEPGRSMRAALAGEGIDVSGVTFEHERPTDSATVIVSTTPPDRTIYWHQGARLVRGDRIDIPHLFGHDLVLLDVDDAPLRRFLLDLPAHTLPATRLLGSLTYLDDAGSPDALDLVMRHDAIVGNIDELIGVTGACDLEQALAAVRGRMRGENLRAAMISLGAEGSLAFTVNEIWRAPAYGIDVVDTTGAGDAFAGAVAFALACRWPWSETLRFANAVAACAITAVGAQTALPRWDEVVAFLSSNHATQ